MAFSRRDNKFGTLRIYGSREILYINLIKEGILALSYYIIKRTTSLDRRSVYYELDIDIYSAYRPMGYY